MAVVESVYTRVARRICAQIAFRELPIPGKAMYFLFRCGLHVTSVPGLWSARRTALAEEWGFTLRGFDLEFARLAKAGFIESEWKAGVVWMPGVIDDDDPRNINIVAGWTKHLRLIPDCDLKRRGVAELNNWLQQRKDWFSSYMLGPNGLESPGTVPPNGTPKPLRGTVPANDPPERLAKHRSGSGSGSGSEEEKEKESGSGSGARNRRGPTQAAVRSCAEEFGLPDDTLSVLELAARYSDAVGQGAWRPVSDNTDADLRQYLLWLRKDGQLPPVEKVRAQ
ncbi:MAG TPA: hypothetical protein VK843_16985 [Planctomycetota bacterium]|nr:hypothetical protein [Planctomycetota bacterium]